MTPNELNQMLIGNIEAVVSHLLPNGKRIGHSWCAGSVAGEDGQSLRVCLSGARAGLWSDFSDNAKGGDLIELWHQARGLSFVDTLKEIKDFLGVKDQQFTTFKRTKNKPQKPKCTKPKDQIKEWFAGRMIKEETYNAYKTGQSNNTIVFPFFSPSGDLELVKYRDIGYELKNGKKHITSNTDPEYHLYGWQAISDNADSVVICEGEIDAMTWHQNGYPALSVPQGAGTGSKQEVWIENDFDRLERFRTIYISMDMDQAGQSSIETIIDRLGRERCQVVNLGSFKDANEAYVNGENLDQFIKASRTEDPKELTQLIEHHDDIMREFENYSTTGTMLPWQKTHQQVRLRPAEISVWAGINSHGKSAALSQVAIDAIAQGEKVCIASMEMRPQKLGRKMYQQILISDKPSQGQASKAVDFLEDRLWLFEVYGTAKAERILDVFLYARKRYGINHFIVDSLAKCGYAEDDYNKQKMFVDRLMEFAGKHGVHVHLVVHIRKKEDENKIPGKMDIKGTGAITDMVDNVFIWWRNKPKEAGDPGAKFVYDSVLNCEKQRDTGEEPMFGLYHDHRSCQFYDDEEEGPKQYVF